jgi:hypothetical protein
LVQRIYQFADPDSGSLNVISHAKIEMEIYLELVTSSRAYWGCEIYLWRERAHRFQCCMGMYHAEEELAVE